MRKKFIITSICLVLMAFMILIFSMAVPMANQNYVVKTDVEKYTAGVDTPAVVAIVVENYRDRSIGRIAIKSYKMSHYYPDPGLIEREDHIINSYADGRISSETIRSYEDGELTETREVSEITYDATLGPYRGPQAKVLEGHSSVTLAQFSITVPPMPGAIVTIEDVCVANVVSSGNLRRVIGKTDGASIVSETL